MKIIELYWDSLFFGFPVGKLIVDPATFSIRELHESANDYRLVYVQSKESIADDELKFGDTKVTFAKAPENLTVSHDVEEARPVDLDSIKEIGLQSGEWSRFKLDTRFTDEQFKALYYKWVEASIDKTIAYSNLIIRENGIAKGLLTLGESNTGESNIGLFAVSETSRGKGYGKMLLNAANNISFARNDSCLTVATQGKNEAACNVYLKSGFTVVSEVWIYNYWNDSFAL
jgi:dTDP-4-amino-4,6-dideoxy-D-galactose acyltransferase